jgi:hypothetical protein
VDLVLVGDEEVALAEVRVVVDVGGVVDRCAHDPGVVDDLVQLLGRVPARPLADDLVQEILVLAPGVMGGEALVLGQVLVAHELRQPPPERVVVGGDDDPLAVARAVDVGGRDARQARAGGLPDDARLLVLEDRRLHDREARVGDRGVDDLAGGAAGVAGVEREQDALEGRLRGERVAQAEPGARRRLTRVAVDPAQARDRLAGRREAGAVAVAAGLPVARHPREDRLRVAGVDVLGAEAPPLHRPRAEVLDHDVGALAQPQRDPLAGLLAEVERHRALVAREDRPPQRVVVVAQAAPVAHRVAARRRLDLDHVGPEVAEQRADVRAGEQLAELDHAQALQRAVAQRAVRVRRHRRSPP